MTWTRREFVKQGLFLGSTAALFQTASLRALYGAPGGSNRILVLVELDGGNDGLNTVVPFGKDGGSYYSEFRPTLGISEGSLLKLDAELALNPGLAEVKAHYDAGRVAIVQGVHYPGADFSHEVSRLIWARGSTETTTVDGWLGRLLAQYPAPSFPCAVDLQSQLNPIFEGAPSFVPAFTSTWAFKFPYDSHHWSDKGNRRVAYETAVAAGAGGGGAVGAMSDTSVGLLSLIDTFATLPEFTHSGSYPEHYFASYAKLVARLVNAGYGMTIFHLRLGGFDTHADQETDGYHTERLALVSQTIQALYDDFVSMGKSADALFVVYSEFGRTVYQNGSGGTDHGTTNPVLVLGDAVVGGQVTPHPSMDPGNLDGHGELAMSTDFRDVFATVVDHWYGAPVASVFPGHGYTDLGFLP